MLQFTSVAKEYMKICSRHCGVGSYAKAHYYTILTVDFPALYKFTYLLTALTHTTFPFVNYD